MNANERVLTAPTRRANCSKAATTYRFYSWRRPPEESVPIIGHDAIYDPLSDFTNAVCDRRR